MKRKPSTWERFADFVSGKGFYLVILLCVAVIGVSGYFLVRSFTVGTEDPAAAAAAGSTQLPDAGGLASARPSPSAVTGPSPAVSPTPALAASPSPAPSPRSTPAPSPSASAAAQPSEDPQPAPSRKPAALVFTWPVNGPVIASYSVEALVYDETMLDWRTHDGLDLAAETGTRVLATAAGVVEQLYEDDLMGTTLVIDHDNGLTSVYANLDPDVKVAVGDEVYTGDIIGAVGATAAAESGRDPHLHFAMYLDDVPVNPEEYMPN